MKKDRVQLAFDEQYNENIDWVGYRFDDEMEDRLRSVEKSLDNLGDPCKGILMQYYYHKRSIVEIAEILNYKNGETVKTIKYKCLKRLREVFKAGFNELNEQWL